MQGSVVNKRLDNKKKKPIIEETFYAVHVFFISEKNL